MHARAANIYRKVSIDSASPERVLDELFTRALRDCREAEEYIEAGDVAGKARTVGHAMRIVVALSGALDHKAAPTLCAALGQLYQFVHDRLVQASAEMDAAPLADAQRILEQLRAAFTEARGRRAA